MSEEEKDILVSKRKYWTKIMKYNLVGTIFLVILFFLMAITIGDSCDGKVSEAGMGCNLVLIFILLFYLFLFISWPLSFIIYGYQSFKIYKINTKELLKQRQRQHEAQLEHIENKNIETKKKQAMEKEEALDYDSAIKIWEEIGEINEAARVRKLKTETKMKQAMEREEALDYDSAIKIWEEIGEINEAARVRKLKTEEGAVKVTQKVVHGDEVTKTEIKDSVLNRSNVGSGGDDKIAKIKELKELHDAGAIDDDEFKQMKKEILGK